jgi:tetratricopeptide (TPR) repeat protein
MRDAATTHRSALTIYEARLGRDDARTVAVARNLGNTLVELDAFAEAERVLAAALAGAERLGSPGVLADVGLGLAGLALARSDPAAARARLRQTRERAGAADRLRAAELSVWEARVDIQESNLGRAQEQLETASVELAALGEPGEPAWRSAQYNLGAIAILRGRFPEAERLFSGLTEAYGRDLETAHPALGRAYHSLAICLAQLGRQDEALAMFRRAEEVLRTAVGDGAGSVGDVLVERSALLSALGRYDEAVGEVRTARSLFERDAAVWRLNIGYADSALGLAQLGSGDAASAVRSLESAIEAIAAAGGAESADLGPPFTRLGIALRRSGDLAGAARALGRAVAIREKDGARSLYGLASALSELSETSRELGQHEEALEHAREATRILGERGEAALPMTAGGGIGQPSARSIFERHLRLLTTGPDAADRNLDELFEVAQYPHLSATAAALSGMAARFAGGRGALADLLRRRQDAVEARRALDGLLLAAIASGTARTGSSSSAPRWPSAPGRSISSTRTSPGGSLISRNLRSLGPSTRWTRGRRWRSTRPCCSS